MDRQFELREHYQYLRQNVRRVGASDSEALLLVGFLENGQGNDASITDGQASTNQNGDLSKRKCRHFDRFAANNRNRCLLPLLFSCDTSVSKPEAVKETCQPAGCSTH